MKKLFTFFSVVMTLAFLYVPQSYAQLNAEGLKWGIQGNVLLPFDDNYNQNSFADAYQFSALGRLFLRTYIAEGVEAELAAGYGRYQGKDFANLYGVPSAKYVTDIVPIDLRFNLSLFESPTWNPYVFIGGGALYYNVKYYHRPNVRDFQNPGQAVEKEGWTGFVPAGIGAKFALSDAVLFEVQASFTYTFTENLNYYKILDSPNDAYAGLGIGFTFQDSRGTSDDDKDGLTKKEEIALGTNPEDPDTDKDGLKDGEEVNRYNTRPLHADSDNDGLRDGDEVLKHTTNPLKADTDNDGLTDNQEVTEFKTDPTKADTDNDQLNDGQEVKEYKSNPMNPDTDGDKLKDGEEVNHKTNLLQVDTDGDKLNDGDEVLTHKTDPLKVDTDVDTLSDYDEVITHKSNPLNVDTDAGTVNDGEEVKRGTNPNDASDDVVKVGVPIVLEGITFATNKADITPESAVILEGALRTLQNNPDIIVEISGHTDNVGSNKSNQRLSQRRAEAVKAWLVSKGIDASRITAAGYGEDQPRVANDTDENKRLNRRIEFKRIK